MRWRSRGREAKMSNLWPFLASFLYNKEIYWFLGQGSHFDHHPFVSSHHWGIGGLTPIQGRVMIIHTYICVKDWANTHRQIYAYTHQFALLFACVALRTQREAILFLPSVHSISLASASHSHSLPRSHDNWLCVWVSHFSLSLSLPPSLSTCN